MGGHRDVMGLGQRRDLLHLQQAAGAAGGQGGQQGAAVAAAGLLKLVESGKVVSFTSEVAKPNGDKVQQKVVRVGTFNVVSEDGMYLQFVPAKGTLEELASTSSSFASKVSSSWVLNSSCRVRSASAFFSSAA